MANNNETINKCLPGGLAVLEKLGTLLEKDITPYVAEMEKKWKPKQLAVIREAECIGCKKCINVCPVDAIIGTGKLMHAVIGSECTGCDLCVARCPVDCIDMITTTDQSYQTDHARLRFESRNSRLEKALEQQKRHQRSHVGKSADQKKADIAASLKRMKLKHRPS